VDLLFSHCRTGEGLNSGGRCFQRVFTQLNCRLFSRVQRGHNPWTLALGGHQTDFDGGSSQGFSNPKSQSWKNRLVNGSFPSLSSSLEPTTKHNNQPFYLRHHWLRHHWFTTSMSSASDSSPSLKTAFRRVIEGGPDKEDNIIFVNEKTSCEAEKVRTHMFWSQPAVLSCLSSSSAASVLIQN
jgi:hypothetical protein